MSKRSVEFYTLINRHVYYIAHAHNTAGVHEIEKAERKQENCEKVVSSLILSNYSKLKKNLYTRCRKPFSISFRCKLYKLLFFFLKV